MSRLQVSHQISDISNEDLAPAFKAVKVDLIYHKWRIDASIIASRLDLGSDEHVEYRNCSKAIKDVFRNQYQRLNTERNALVKIGNDTLCNSKF